MKITEIFTSIQGEGRYIGKPQTFIRLSGCNMRCSYCDTKYSWKDGREKSVDSIMKKVKSLGLKSVCITGGEPMLQAKELKELLKKLKKCSYETVLETNGTLYDKTIFALVDCVSADMKPPSSGAKSDERILNKLRKKDQVKIIIADDKDLKYAQKIIAKTRVEVILQPEGGKNIKSLVDKVLSKKITARVLPQLHKLINVK